MFGMDKEPLYLEEFSEFLLGTTKLSVTCDVCITYDYDKCIQWYMDKHLMTEDKAKKEFKNKYLDKFLGNDTPVFVIIKKDK